MLLLSLAGSNVPKGVYIHVPFCRRRCYYCSFPIKVIGERESTIENESNVYTSILLEDIKNEVAYRSSITSLSNVDTIYFGGGTPSLLSDECKRRFEV